MLNSKDLTTNEKTSILYHNLFDYPLSFSDLIKWISGKQLLVDTSSLLVTNKRGFYFLEGREGLIYKRILRKRISAKKMKIARKVSKILSFIPTVKMVGITGSLAMENSAEESDIDLMIVTKSGSLWTTRLVILVLLVILRVPFRRAGRRDQRDKLCLNMWLDEKDLAWRQKDRNMYSSHEIAQIVPLVNKDKTFERFLFQNKWILNFWPKAVRIKNFKTHSFQSGFNIFEKLAFKLQYLYMKNKVSRETITPTRALFHPQDWAKVVMGRLSP